MGGYNYHPKIRMTPDNGIPETFDMRTLMTDASGQTKTALRYQDEGTMVEDVNYKIRRVERGLRPEVLLTFDIATMADHSALATITSRLIRRDWLVELSLDAGTTFRAVELLRLPPTPRPFRGKTIGGATFVLALRCVELIPDLPAMTEGVSPW